MFKKEKKFRSKNAERIAKLADLPQKRPKKRRLHLLRKNLPKITLSEKQLLETSEQWRSKAIQLKNLMETHLQEDPPPRTTNLASTITIRTTTDAEMILEDLLATSNLSVFTRTIGSITSVDPPPTSKISTGTKTILLADEDVPRMDCNRKVQVTIDPRPIMGLTTVKTMVIRPRITTRDIKTMDIREVIRGDRCRGTPIIIDKVGTCRGLVTLENPTRLRISTALMAVEHQLLLTREELQRCNIHENDEVFFWVWILKSENSKLTSKLHAPI